MAAMLERIEKPGMTAHVAFPQQLGQVFLGSSSRAVDGAVVVAPRKTRTSHRCRPRPTICPVLQTNAVPLENLAHGWHTGADHGP